MGGPPICPACKDKAEQKFQEVKAYVKEHRTATMKQITEDCEVERKQVEQWVREERLIFSEDSPIKLTCELCGTVITTGRYCENCKKSTANNISQAGQRPAPAAKGPAGAGGPTVRMHTFHNGSGN